MPRAKGGFKTHRRHMRLLKLAKGYRGSRSKRFRQAAVTVIKALSYAYRDRRNKKRDFRSLWIQRINAAARLHGMSYSRLIDGLHKQSIDVDRKILAELAVSDPQGFKALLEEASQAVH